MIQFEPFGVGHTGTLAYVANAMLGAMDPFFAAADKRVFGEASMAQSQRMLELLGYDYFLDEQVDMEKWMVLAAEYHRITGESTYDFADVARESVRLDDLHERIALRAAEMAAEGVTSV